MEHRPQNSAMMLPSDILSLGHHTEQSTSLKRRNLGTLSVPQAEIRARLCPRSRPSTSGWPDCHVGMLTSACAQLSPMEWRPGLWGIEGELPGLPPKETVWGPPFLGSCVSLVS